MRWRDYFRSESKIYEHLCPEKREARVTELWVGVGFGVFSLITVLFAHAIRLVHDNPQWFRMVQE